MPHRCLGIVAAQDSPFAVATSVGVQKVVPSSQLIRFDGLPCESRGSQAAPPDAAQTGAVVTPNAVRRHRVPLRTRGGSDASTHSSRQQPSALLTCVIAA